MSKQSWWITPNSCTAAALGLLAACALIAPKFVYHFSHDGGFVENGEKINLNRWTHILAYRNGGAILGINRPDKEIIGINRPDREPPSHYESWINTGQWLRFDHVPITRRSRFIAEVRVHPEWPRNRATEVEFRIFASAEGRPPLQAVFVPRLDKQTEWTRIELDLAPLAGHDAGIQLEPSANQEVWTLMRDPKIVIVEDRAPR
ncbi:hypothetical protein [Xanthomonas phaseoli]|uniref:hypothetical protein n=1 Tax=Xanthomonas phaseoli TaxID=1985254 RepID=UPI001E416061|nr:hypothetical protein [Xanthomonas phaseoli]MCC8471803.1 hypothetical protein [Xanthomonas phaseoli]